MADLVMVPASAICTPFGPRKGRRGSGKRLGVAVHDDLLARAFTVARSDETWLADITAHRTAPRKLYLCAMTDI